LGLEHGKSGVIIFFYNYFRFTGLSVYEDFADELLDEMQNCIKIYNSDFRKSICGIGLCFEYLIHSRFIETENEVMEELDICIMKHVDIKSKGIDNGLRGAAYYVILRSFADSCLLEKEFIANLYKLLFNLQENDTEIDFLTEQLSNLMKSKTIECSNLLQILLKDVTYTEHSFYGLPVYSLENGLTGTGLKIIQDITNNG
jgi:lantibiotic modifying enzyme